jgi:hypothetical protein
MEASQKYVLLLQEGSKCLNSNLERVKKKKKKRIMKGQKHVHMISYQLFYLF